MNSAMNTPREYIPENARTETFGNGVSFEVAPADIVTTCKTLIMDKHFDLKLMTATDERSTCGCFKIWYIFGKPGGNQFIVPYIKLTDTVEFPSLSPTIHRAWNYERKIRSFFGLIPRGHRDVRPLILHENWPTDRFPLRKDFLGNTRPQIASGTYRFQKISGEGIYEIPVGPVHAGIIEPGHFRFSVAGEEIMLLEPRLGYTHKGSEKLFEQLPLAQALRLSEKVSGDSSFSHSLAFCQALEKLGGQKIPRRAGYLRLIFAELERLANHFGDIGAIMVDTGFNFGGSQGARLRETIMRMSDRLTGSRFLRGVNIPGGVTNDIDSASAKRLSLELGAIEKDFLEIIDAAENSASLLNRMKSTGIITRKTAEDHGAVGIAARATGMPCDARSDYPYAAYPELGFIDIATELDGDVYARFSVRVKEVGSSIFLIRQALRGLPEGPIAAAAAPVLTENAFAIGIVEGWRGDIVCFVATDEQGRIRRVAPRDPSFINWSLLEYAAPGNIVPDFPLINKSFNLSYSGFDL